MARDPEYKLNIDTGDAVKSLQNVEGQAVETEKDIEKLDGETIKISTGDTVRALEDVSRKLDDADEKARKAGTPSGGIGTTTSAFKDLTEGIGGPGAGGTAVGALFGFGETFEGLGDILEGFGPKLGLTDEQVGNFTSRLGTGLAVLGGLGVALSIGSAAIEAFGKDAEKARKAAKAFDQQIEDAAANMRDLATAMKEGREADALVGILEDITPLLDDMARFGLDAKDAIAEITGQGTPFTDKIGEMIAGIDGLDASSVFLMTDLIELGREVESRRLGMERAGEQDIIAKQVLDEYGLTVQDTTQYERDRIEAIKDRAAEVLAGIDAERAFERALDDVQTALEEYNQKLIDAKGDTEEVEDATRDAADEVIDLAKDYGSLQGAAVGTEDWSNRTIAALGYVAATLAPGSPLRAELNNYIAELKTLPTEVGTKIRSEYTDPTASRAVGGVQAGAVSNTTVNVNVQSADPNAVVRALQQYVRQNGGLPSNIR